MKGIDRIYPDSHHSTFNIQYSTYLKLFLLRCILHVSTDDKSDKCGYKSSCNEYWIIHAHGKQGNQEPKHPEENCPGQFAIGSLTGRDICRFFIFMMPGSFTALWHIIILYPKVSIIISYCKANLLLLISSISLKLHTFEKCMISP